MTDYHNLTIAEQKSISRVFSKHLKDKDLYTVGEDTLLLIQEEVAELFPHAIWSLWLDYVEHHPKSCRPNLTGYDSSIFGMHVYWGFWDAKSKEFQSMWAFYPLLNENREKMTKEMETLLNMSKDEIEEKLSKLFGMLPEKKEKDV